MGPTVSRQVSKFYQFMAIVVVTITSRSEQKEFSNDSVTVVPW